MSEDPHLQDLVAEQSRPRRVAGTRIGEPVPLIIERSLELTYYLGHSCGEIAAIMECPINTVKTRMFHARNKLRALVPILAAPRGEAQRIPSPHRGD